MVECYASQPNLLLFKVKFYNISEATPDSYVLLNIKELLDHWWIQNVFPRRRRIFFLNRFTKQKNSAADITESDGVGPTCYVVSDS